MMQGEVRVCLLISLIFVGGIMRYLELDCMEKASEVKRIQEKFAILDVLFYLKCLKEEEIMKRDLFRF